MSFFSKPKVHSVLIVDIASSSVGVGLSGVRAGQLPELVVTTRVPFAHKEDFDTAHIERAMLLALRDALNVAFREGTKLLANKGYPTSVNHSVISFSSPWFVSKLGGKQSDFVSELMEKYESDMELFGSDYRMYNATDKRLLKRIEDEILRVFGIKEGVSVENFTVMFSRVMDHAFDNIDPALFVDMTGHTTDILALKKGAYHGHHTVPIGTLKLKDRDLEWNKFWNSLSETNAPDISRGHVFLVADDYGLSLPSLKKLLPNARIIPFHADNGFIDEMAMITGNKRSSEKLAIILAFSNLFL
jgi:hypothetical protein